MGAMEVPDVTKAMLSKLNEQQQLLLQELERTKRRLREEIRARELGTKPQHSDVSDDDTSTEPTSPNPKLDLSPKKRSAVAKLPLSPSTEPSAGSPTEYAISKRSLATRYTGHNRSSSFTRRNLVHRSGGNGLKRSRSEAGISFGNSAESDAMAPGGQGGRKTEQVEFHGRQTAAATRIDMLPVMSSTGEAALEVGLSNGPVGLVWTAQPPERVAAMHMLPVFRLPVVSKPPANGFIRRIPREEKRRERECRVREKEELEKMKVALGLTDRQLATLEEELLSRTKHRQSTQGMNGSSVSSAPNGWDCEDLELKTDSHELLSKAGPLPKHERSAFSGSWTESSANAKPTRGKRRRRFAGPAVNNHSVFNREKKRNKETCWRGKPSNSGDECDNHFRQDSALIDRPTPRILRHGFHSALGAEAGMLSSGTFTRAGQGICSSVYADVVWGTGNASGSVLGTTATTEQLIAAAADVGMVNILELRRELGRSVGQVRSLAQVVKADVQGVIRICPVQHPRAVQFLRRWACHRLATLADEILLSRAAAALERWRKTISLMAMTERKQAYFRYQGSRKMAFAVDKAYLRRLAKGWIRWVALVEAGRADERRALEISAAVTVQTEFRGFAARRRRQRLAVAAADRLRYNAAVAITRCAKGKVARMGYGRLRADLQRTRAYEMLRRVGRGMLGRRKARRLREQRARLKVAISFQRLFRGREGRRIFLVYRKATRERIAATKLQAITRGISGRQRAERIRRVVRESAAAAKIQRLARMWLAQRLVGRLRDEMDKSRKIRTAAALSIQRVYRGHRSRVLHGARLAIQRSRLHEENAAATKIQALVRAHLSKRVVAKMAKKRKEERTEDARAWIETWSEDAQAWFYFNAQTDEALWEPPRTGYTKHDGRLVLASGEVAEDPLSGLTEEERSEAKKQSSCVECEEKLATRKCEQCGDGYCTRCFRKTHASGRRTRHTWEHVGPMECAECEAEVAIKWCTSCDDPFCGSCWANIHSRGQRSKHNHCAISPAGRVSSKATGPDGTDAGPFTPGDSLKAETVGAGVGVGGAAQGREYGAAVVEAGSFVSDWQEHADDNGTPYWYSSSTGVSQYENPHAQQVAWNGGSITSASVEPGAGGAVWGGGQTRDAVHPDPYARAIVPAEVSTREWSEHYDDGGFIYYYNAVTGASQYESPF